MPKLLSWAALVAALVMGIQAAHSQRSMRPTEVRPPLVEDSAPFVGGSSAHQRYFNGVEQLLLNQPTLDDLRRMPRRSARPDHDAGNAQGIEKGDVDTACFGNEGSEKTAAVTKIRSAVLQRARSTLGASVREQCTEDAVQDTLVRMLNACGRLKDKADAETAAYIFKIAENRAKTCGGQTTSAWSRSVSLDGDEDLDLASGDPSIDDVIIRKEDAKARRLALHQLVDALSPKERAVLSGLIMNMEQKDLAVAMGISEPRVSQYKVQIRQKWSVVRP